MRGRPMSELEQQVVALKAQTFALKKSNNDLEKAARLQKVKEQKLVDGMRQLSRGPPADRRASVDAIVRERETDAHIQSIESETVRLRQRNMQLQEMLRVASDRGPGPRTPGRAAPNHRPRPHHPPRHVKKENDQSSSRKAENVKQMLDKIGERVANSEMLHARASASPTPASPSVVVSPAAVPGPTDRDLLDLNQRLRDSNAKVQILEHQFDQMEAAMAAGKQVQKHAVDQVDKYKALLADSQTKRRAAQDHIKELELCRDQSESLSLIIDDLRATNVNLQAQVDALTKSAFLGDQAETRRLQGLEADHLGQISDLRAMLLDRDTVLQSSTDKLGEQMGKIQALESDLASARTDLQLSHKEMARTRSRLQQVEDRVHVFSADSGVELEELDRALDMIRRQKDHVVRGNGSGEVATIPALQRKVRELEILNKDLVTELKCKDDMLRMQTHLNSELDAEFTRIKSENLELKQDMFRVQRSAAARPRAESVISDMSLLSQLSTLSFSGNHNVVVVRIAGARMKNTCAALRDPHQAHGGPAADPLTFVGVDFFDFETCYSGVFGGFEPHYKLTAQYKVDVDSFLLEHLESKEIVIDLYRQTSMGDVKRVGICRVPLKGLLGYSLKIRDSFDAVDINDPSVVLGSLEVVAKMYRPIVSSPPSAAASAIGDGTPFTMRMTMAISALMRDGAGPALAAHDFTLHAHNMYYNVDGVVERIKTAGDDAKVGTFALEFYPKHDRLLPHELIQLEVLRDTTDQPLIGHVDLLLTQIAQAPCGQVQLSLPLKDENDQTIGACEMVVEWILSRDQSP